MRLNTIIDYYARTNFNPRTHRGVRHMCNPSLGQTLKISIHAPIVGCDASTTLSGSFNMIFQSTHPSWGATYGTNNGNVYQTLFQSTHPSWGATMAMQTDADLCNISIHAPIVGCDSFTVIVHVDFNNFNPRTHRGVRPEELGVNVYGQEISIHAPIVGCDG